MLTIFGWIFLLWILKESFFFGRRWYEEKEYDSQIKRMAKYRQVNRCLKCKIIVNSNQRFGRFCPHCHARGDLLFMNIYEVYEDGYGKTLKENTKEQE